MDSSRHYSIITASDFHLFDPFSGQQEKGWARLKDLLSREQPKYCVLNGDIFEARDRVRRPLVDVIDGAKERLKDLSNSYPDMTFIYILGNHERVKEFVDAIEPFCKSLPNMELHHTQRQIGNALFLHGDYHLEPKRHAHPYGSYSDAGVLEQAKTIWRKCRTQYGGAAGLSKYIFPPKKTLRKIEETLEKELPKFSGITDIFSGHTHDMYINYTGKSADLIGIGPMPGILRFRHHNTGSAMTANNLNILRVGMDAITDEVTSVRSLTQRSLSCPRPEEQGKGR